MNTISRLLRPMTFCVVLLLAACVTVNIYFPAAEVRRTAEEIVDDVYGKTPQDKPAPKPGDQSSLERLLSILGPTPAMAQDAATVSNAAIRAIRQNIADRHGQLAPYYQSGAVGIANNGMLVLRSQDGLPMPQVAQLRGLINADNADRQRLNQEVAKAINQPQNTAQVAKIFADQWRAKAAPGWWIQEDNGAWRRK